MPRETPIGRVVHVTPRGALVTHAANGLPVRLPGEREGTRIGESVGDARREYVGRVGDILGPVARPYVVVLPERGAKLHRLLGQELYATPAVQPPRGPPRGGSPRGPPPAGRGPRSSDRRGPPSGAGGRPPRGPPPKKGGDSRRDRR